MVFYLDWPEWSKQSIPSNIRSSLEWPGIAASGGGSSLAGLTEGEPDDIRLGWGESLTINLKTVDTPFCTMFHTIVFDVVTPYMHFTIHYPSYLYKKVAKKHVWKKSGLLLKLLL